MRSSVPKFIIELQGNSNCEIQYKVTFSGENDGGSCKENYTPAQFMSKAEYNKQCAQEVYSPTRRQPQATKNAYSSEVDCEFCHVNTYSPGFCGSLATSLIRLKTST